MEESSNFGKTVIVVSITIMVTVFFLTAGFGNHTELYQLKESQAIRTKEYEKQIDSYQRQISEFCDAFDKNADLINQILLIRDDYKKDAESLRAEVSELKK